MRRTHRALAGGLLLSLLWACGDDRPTPIPDLPPIADTTGVTRTIDNNRPVWTDTVFVSDPPTLVIGSGARGPEYELYRVMGAVRLSDGRVVVVNSGAGELRWYDPTGRYLSTSGRLGDGPGEFQYIQRAIRLPGDSLLAVDARLRRYSVLDPDGQLIRTVRVEGPREAPLPVARFEDRSILMVSSGVFALGAQGPPRVERLPLEVLEVREGRSEPEVIETFPGLAFDIGPTGGRTSDGSMPIGRNLRPFGRNTFVAGDARGWVVGDNDRPRVEVRGPGAEVVAVAEWPHEARRVTAADVEAFRAPILERLADAEARNRMLDAWADHPSPPKTMPAFSWLFLDDEGNIWVKEYAPSFEPDPNRYLVFDRAGVWLGTVVAPKGTTVLAVGDRSMLGLQRDELDVESVVQFGFDPPWS